MSDKSTTVYFNSDKGATVTLNLKNVHGYYSVMAIDKATGDVYYRRKSDQGKLSINFPIHPSQLAIVVIGNADIDNYLVGSLKIVEDNYKLEPEVKRDFGLEDLKIQYVDDLVYTPARIFTKGENRGLMQISRKHFRDYDIPTRYFIKLHELGHLYFKDESATDRFALHYFLKKGYNLSSAFYALRNVLKTSEDNIDRLMQSIEQLKEVNNYNQ